MTIRADADKIAAKMQALGENAVRALERKVLRDAAKQVQARAIEHAPEDTGRLKRGIKVRAGRRSRWLVSVNVVSTVPYARVIEFGEMERRVLNQQPYMRPALDETRDAVREEIRAGLRRAIIEAPL